MRVQVFVFGRDFTNAQLCTAPQPSPQLGPALAHEVLLVDLVALRPGERQVQVDGEPCPIDLVTCRRPVTR